MRARAFSPILIFKQIDFLVLQCSHEPLTESVSLTPTEQIVLTQQLQHTAGGSPLGRSAATHE